MVLMSTHNIGSYAYGESTKSVLTFIRYAPYVLLYNIYIYIIEESNMYATHIMSEGINYHCLKLDKPFHVIQSNEPRSEKTGLRGFRPGPTQTGLYSYRR